MVRFVRGFLWGGVLGALVGVYLLSDPAGSRWRERYRAWRLRRADGERGPVDAHKDRPSRFQLALDAGRAAVDAALALLGRRA